MLKPGAGTTRRSTGFQRWCLAALVQHSCTRPCLTSSSRRISSMGSRLCGNLLTTPGRAWSPSVYRISASNRRCQAASPLPAAAQPATALCGEVGLRLHCGRPSLCAAATEGLGLGDCCCLACLAGEEGLCTASASPSASSCAQTHQVRVIGARVFPESHQPLHACSTARPAAAVVVGRQTAQAAPQPPHLDG